MYMNVKYSKEQKKELRELIGEDLDIDELCEQARLLNISKPSEKISTYSSNNSINEKMLIKQIKENINNVNSEKGKKFKNEFRKLFGYDLIRVVEIETNTRPSMFLRILLESS